MLYTHLEETVDVVMHISNLSTCTITEFKNNLGYVRGSKKKLKVEVNSHLSMN